MDTPNQMAEDLRFVRQAVEAREKSRRPHVAHLILWTVYSLTVLPAMDFFPHQAPVISWIGLGAGVVGSMILGRIDGKKSGIYDRAEARRTMLHWFGGIVLLLVAVFGMACVDPDMRGPKAGEMSVVLVGFLYFLAGVHFPENRFMLWAGPLMVVVGIASSALTEYRYTAIGAMFAACLLSPIIFGRKNVQAKANPTV